MVGEPIHHFVRGGLVRLQQQVQWIDAMQGEMISITQSSLSIEKRESLLLLDEAARSIENADERSRLSAS